jgi:hypothetical protein
MKVTIEVDELKDVLSNSKGEEDIFEDLSPYARWFDDTCRAWTKDPEYNLMFLRAQQTYANDLLKAKGHLFLNEVYDMFDISRSSVGQIVGWIYNENNPVGDNFVDFGLYSLHNKECINGLKRDFILDFNVDGIIIDKI